MCVVHAATTELFLSSVTVSHHPPHAFVSSHRIINIRLQTENLAHLFNLCYGTELLFDRFSVTSSTKSKTVTQI